MSDTHELLVGQLTRRGLLRAGSMAALAATVNAALPAAARARIHAAGTVVSDGTDATLQAFADTILPGRKITRTELGNPVHAGAVLGADRLPGAVEADALALYHHPEVGFDPLAGPFLAELSVRSLERGGEFLTLGFPARVQVCLDGLDFANSTRLIWEAAAAVPFTAFCAAALHVNATAKTACGYRVMGLPGVAPGGYRNFSYRRALAPERTRHGSLP